ncbi:hypothetical protein PVAND_002884 [Polypedilum vanderplanki]|uniref:SAM domain-containing protein n=1 Tax=Polypedilum vanderplanki TaxID=319348 RepID=A0A9J6BU20_POLVA|nr:hypothetical protein PVAND_002884 [Polypedilum vanderplanki]
MTSICYLPAGYEDSDEDEYGDYYLDKPAKKFSPIKKSSKEVFIDNLVRHLKYNDVDSLRNELDKGNSEGFDIDSPVEGSWNLLFCACFDSRPEIVEFLINERNANVNVSNEEMSSPFIIACMSTYDSESVLKIAKLLLEKDPRLMQKRNAKGETPMMIAANKGHLNVIEYLISLGDSIDNVNNCGRNALFYAIEGDQKQVAAKLFENKIDYTISDCYGETPKSVAEANHAFEIISLFPPKKYKYETPSIYLNYSSLESIIGNNSWTSQSSTVPLEDIEEEIFVPPFFPDVVCLLNGMGFERFVPLFAKANISLEEFLTINDKRLEEIGIELPYHRRKILHKLQQFFNEKWNNKSIYLPPHIKYRVSPEDLINVLANLLRQTVVAKSHLLYLKELNVNENVFCDKMILEKITELKKHIKELQNVISKAEVTKRPLFIPKQNSLRCNIKPNAQDRNIMKKNIIVMPIIILLSVVAIKFLKN